MIIYILAFALIGLIEWRHRKSYWYRINNINRYFDDAREYFGDQFIPEIKKYNKLMDTLSKYLHLKM